MAVLGLAGAVPAHAAAEDTAPTAVIAGDNTTLADTYGIAFDAAGLIYAANNVGDSIAVFAAGSTGDATPLRVISGDSTTLNAPAGIAIAANGDIYVANYGGNSVVVFAADASGDSAPLRIIEGLDSSIAEPWSLDFDSTGNLVLSELNSHILVFPAGESIPQRDITVPTGRYIYGVTVDGDGTIYASVFDSNAIDVFDPSANGEATPVRIISGEATALLAPIGIDVSGGILTVAQYQSNSVLTFNSTDTGNVAPIRNIVGDSTTLQGPVGLAVDPQGNIFVGNQNGSISIFAALAPTIASVSPSVGTVEGGTVVTITGTNFSSGTTVTIGGVVATGVVVTSPTLLTAVVPAHAVGAVDVTVSTSGGAATLAAAFTYTPVAATSALAATGIDLTVPASLAGGLLVLGALALVARRRRA